MPIKYIVTALIVLLIGSNAFWLYALVDDAVTCMYSDASHDMTDQMYRQALALANLNLVGLNVEQAKAKVGKDIHGFDPFEKEGCLYVGQICLQISEKGIVDAVRAPNP